MSSRGTDLLTHEVIAANRDFYRDISRKYDHYESCARDRYFQSMLEQDIAQVASLLPADRPVRCLDCGGGTGNIALKLLRRSWNVTVVDVSPEMLAILEQKCRSSECKPILVNDSLEHFIKSNRQDFDLITFGSVLHHLYSFETVLGDAMECIRPGGVIYTNFDPVLIAHPSLSRTFETVDTLIYKALHDPSDILPGFIRRVRKLGGRHHLFPEREFASAGDLAEFHVKKGIDDVSLIRFYEARGFEVIAHSRYPYARVALLRLLNQRLRLVQSFRMICRRTR
jgi:ubiquinone/menaquinone biosynthesis C-methylase UbiE